jgi:hypothetical protein
LVGAFNSEFSQPVCQSSGIAQGGNPCQLSAARKSRCCRNDGLLNYMDLIYTKSGFDT